MGEPWTLVTGAAGFVGSRLVKLLIERGQRVKAFVRPGSNLKMLQGFPADRLWLAFGDITVEHTVYRALAGCDRLYHVASNYTLWDSRPERILDPAVKGTRATLTAAHKRELRKIVVTSSAKPKDSSGNGSASATASCTFRPLCVASRRISLDGSTPS